MEGTEMTRYIWQGRASWVPAQHVVVDNATGGIVSRHVSETAAKDAARGMNNALAKRPAR
jgi:hypothetical protein